MITVSKKAPSLMFLEGSYYSSKMVYILKGCVHYTCASLIFKSNGKTRKNVFYLTLNPLFVLEKIKF